MQNLQSILRIDGEIEADQCLKSSLIARLLLLLAETSAEKCGGARKRTKIFIVRFIMILLANLNGRPYEEVVLQGSSSQKGTVRDQAYKVEKTFWMNLLRAISSVLLSLHNWKLLLNVRIWSFKH